jgi:hypothetical protein
MQHQGEGRGEFDGSDVATSREEADAQAEAENRCAARGLLLPDGQPAQGDGKAGDGGDGRLRIVHRHQHAQRADRQQRRGKGGAAAVEPVGGAGNHHQVEAAEQA